MMEKFPKIDNAPIEPGVDIAPGDNTVNQEDALLQASIERAILIAQKAYEGVGGIQPRDALYKHSSDDKANICRLAVAILAKMK